MKLKMRQMAFISQTCCTTHLSPEMEFLNGIFSPRLRTKMKK